MDARNKVDGVQAQVCACGFKVRLRYVPGTTLCLVFGGVDKHKLSTCKKLF